LESNWRFNVWDLGFPPNYWHLIARYPGVTPTTWLASAGPGTGIGFLLRNLYPDRPPVIYGFINISAPPWNFPWGEPVEPDEPV